MMDDCIFVTVLLCIYIYYEIIIIIVNRYATIFTLLTYIYFNFNLYVNDFQ